MIWFVFWTDSVFKSFLYKTLVLNIFLLKYVQFSKQKQFFLSLFSWVKLAFCACVFVFKRQNHVPHVCPQTKATKIFKSTQTDCQVQVPHDCDLWVYFYVSYSKPCSPQAPLFLLSRCLSLYSTPRNTPLFISNSAVFISIVWRCYGHDFDRTNKVTILFRVFRFVKFVFSILL